MKKKNKKIKDLLSNQKGIALSSFNCLDIYFPNGNFRCSFTCNDR